MNPPNSKRDLVFRWKVRDVKTLKCYAQEPIIKRGSSTTMDFCSVLDQIFQEDINPGSYEFSLEILKVMRYPKAPGEELKISKLKDGEFVSLINKSKFLKYETFVLSRNKNGLLIVQPS